MIRSVAVPVEHVKNPFRYPPMLIQYLDYKERYPDCLLFFQVGDFYELFFQDAVTTAQVINLTLTSRDKNSEQPVPMCGVPLSVADQYCDRLVQLGYSVAIVSQVEAPTGKGMVARRLERIITPAIKLLAGADATQAKGLVASVSMRSTKDVAIAYTDVQSGDIQIREGLHVTELPQIFGHVTIAELLLPKLHEGKLFDRRSSWVRACELYIDKKNIKFRSADTSAVRQCQKLENFPSLSPLAKDAVVFLMGYLDEVTVEHEPPLKRVVAAKESGRMRIDAMTRANLELVKNLRDGTERGTLLEYLDKTSTAGGSRALAAELTAPHTDRSFIEQRLNTVEFILAEDDVRDGLEALLSGCPDIERTAARLELEVVTPRELGALRDFLEKLPQLQAFCSSQQSLTLPEDILKDSAELLTQLSVALVDTPPLSCQEGSIFRSSFSVELAHLITLETSSNDWLARFEADEKARSGITSLKVKYTSVFGYFIEIPNSQIAKVPPEYLRKQTTANAERYISEVLKGREDQILRAHDQRLSLEKKLFNALRKDLCMFCSALRQLHHRIATIDFVVALAITARAHRLVRPTIADAPMLHVIDGRHPQVSALLGAQFVANNTDVASDAASPSVLVITGPNMGGKSTYLRQNALLTVLAQIGSFVPAVSATIGIADQIFARLGASDNIAEGESTFMVEMREASMIIRHATNRSLILIDEIGRGTATKDGLALAQSILEWLLVKTNARVLFATHFHELTELSGQYPQKLKNVSVGSTEVEGELLFTHRIIPGAATRSFGIEVAKMAGLPTALIKRARLLLDQRPEVKQGPQLSLVLSDSQFTEEMEDDIKPSHSNPAHQKIIETLQGTDTNQMTPLEALTLLAKFKGSLLIGLCFLFFFCGVVDLPARADFRTEDRSKQLNVEYLRLRNTDSHVSRAEDWKNIADQLVAIAETLPPSNAGQSVFNAATAYGAMYDAHGEPEDLGTSITLFTKVYESYPTSPAAVEALKALYDRYKESDGEKAKLFLSLILKNYPNSSYVDFANAALSGERIGKKTDAKDLAQVKRIIVIDPGHGGEDLGAIGIGGLLEKDLTLEISELVQNILNKDPSVEAILTRQSDVFMPLQQRTEIANQNEAHLFVSIHCNSNPDKTVQGFEIYTLDTAGDASAKKLAERENAADGGQSSDLMMFLGDLIQSAKAPESLELASLISTRVKAAFGSEDFSLKVLKEKKAPFYVLVGAHMPAVLIETAFINNTEDGVNLSRSAFRQRIATAIAEGIQSFLKKSGRR